jgi:adenylate kinase
VVILLFGPPGSGKGTQSRRIGEWLGIHTISTGDLLRSEIDSDSDLGRNLAVILARGDYAGDEVVNRLVERELSRNSVAGAILDGYPRTLEQALFLDRVLARRGLPRPLVIRLEVPVEQLIERLSARRHCPACGRSFQVTHKPPRQEGICDECGSALITRPDDRAEVIAQRQAAYHQLTAPVLAHYGNRCRTIVGTGSTEEVFDRIRAALGPA